VTAVSFNKKCYPFCSCTALLF